ncbi:MAG: hypothetical protein ABJF23_21460 [Bryobacteraceae bacterium]
MRVDDAIEHLNQFAEESVKDQVPMRTTEEVLDFFKNPPKRAYSVPLEEVRSSVVKIFGMADEKVRHAITSRLSVNARNGFLEYAAAMSVLAVRTQAQPLIEQGLIALVIEGGSQDWRDSILVLAKLYNSAAKLGMDTQKVFEKAASIAEPGVIKKELNGFPRRRPEDRDLKAFRQAEEITKEGFAYKQVLPWSLAQGPVNETPARPVETSQQISARLTRPQQDSLITAAGTDAVLAVREQSPKLVERGLEHLALGGGALDSSHSMVALAKLHHAALKLGMNAQLAFAEAARRAPPGDLQTEMIRFPLREPKDRDLAAFNLQEHITESGFAYKQLIPSTRP